MTKKPKEELKEETNQLETEEQEEIAGSDTGQDEQDNESINNKEDGTDNADDKQEGKEPSEEDLEKKRLIYKERQERRKQEEEARKQQEILRQKADKAEETDRTAYLEKVARKLEFDNKIRAAKNELSVYEREFSEAYPDYKDILGDAIEFTKRNLMKKGYSEADALDAIEYEKVMLADAAVRSGRDPVEAVYNEAKNINALIDEFALKRGYIKPDAKTNLQKRREMGRPNAMQGGSAARGVKKGLMDDDNDELDNMTLGQMLKAKRDGVL